MKKSVFSALLSLLLTASAAHTACDRRAAARVADGVSSDFAVLVGFTRAKCAPSVDAGKCAIICISDLNIIGDNRNLALTAITASAATRIRTEGISQFSNITFADRELLTERKYLSIDARTASDIQRTLSVESEHPLKKAARVRAAYSEVAIPKTR
jgi:hypothetical protein